MSDTIREYVNCDLCGSDDSSILFRMKDEAMIEFNNRWKENHYDIYGDDPTFTTVLCNNCGLAYVNPRLTSEILSHFYQEYPPTEQERNEEKRRFTFAKHIERIKRYRKTGRLLDIGCGNGYFLDMARREGYEVEGVEKSQVCCEFARTTLNLNVSSGDFLSPDFTGKGFDIVCLFHTLEHVTSPFQTLQKAFDIMNDNGVVMIVVPNANRALNIKVTKALWGAGCEAHLYAFSTGTLKRMVTKAGFSVISIGTNHLPYDSWEAGSTVREYLVQRYSKHRRIKPPTCFQDNRETKVAEVNRNKNILGKLYRTFLAPLLMHLEDAFDKGMQIELVAQKRSNDTRHA